MAEFQNLRGFSELAKTLEQFPDKFKRNIARGGLRAGAKLIRDDVAARAPIGPPSDEGRRLYGLYPGALRDSARVTTRTKNGQPQASVVVGGKNKKRNTNVWYAHLIEFTGARPHKITPRKGRFLAFGGGLFRSVMHPGFKPKPFMRPAFDSKGRQAIVAVGEYIRNRLATKHGIDTPEIGLDEE